MCIKIDRISSLSLLVLMLTGCQTTGITDLIQSKSADEDKNKSFQKSSQAFEELDNQLSENIIQSDSTSSLSEQETIVEAIRIIDSYKPESAKKVFVRDYDYLASDDDSKNSARQKAIFQIKQLLVEEVGSYIESELNISNAVVSGSALNSVRKEINIISAGVTQTKVLDEKWDGRTFSLKAAVAIDPSSVSQGIAEALKSRANKQEIEELRVILKKKQHEHQLQGARLSKMQQQLATSVFAESAAKKELNDLKVKLNLANKKLEALNADTRKVESKYESIVRAINKSSSLAQKYVRYGMSKSEVAQVAGPPRNKPEPYVDDWNYGDVWVMFEGGVAGCLVLEYPRYSSCSAYFRLDPNKLSPFNLTM